ncbi:TetR/AcrR family transcriptional regulator [Actinoplanes sp. NPDC024001]|uniref:TetR/AcrR family transcriptional regulator n=1 Tax=Actinoplanes sp. NPDC024001 TaxID=3154598 RepID=UPI0033F540CE
MSVASPRRSARERLLEAADELFYAEGVHSVGIDRVIERAGVAKASLYSTFGSKDELVRAYLRGRHESRRARILAGLERFTTPRERLLGVFDVLAERAAQPGFRGCAFYNASAERDPSGVVREEADATRAWTRGLFADLCREAGVPDPEAFADRLVVLYDGATVGARLDPGPRAPLAARGIAAVMLDAVTAGSAP